MSRHKLFYGDHVLEDDSPCFIVAEIGHNHQGSVETAKQMFEVAKSCGVTAVKLQKRDNKSLFTEELYKAPYDNPNSYGSTYGQHREALEFGRDEFLELKKYADELDLIMFSTAFDIPSADFLADLDMPLFKIASADLTNTPLLRHVADLGKPMIVSTGGASIEDVDRAYETVMKINNNLCIMQCTACYPAEHRHLNLNVISTYRERYPDIVVGLSDHVNGIAMAPVAYMLGARMIEKHFTLNRTWKGTDHAFSLGPSGMRRMVRDVSRVREALGDGAKRRYDEENGPLTKMSKKIVASRDLPAGTVLKSEDLALKCPGDGLPPYEMDNVLGSRLLCNLRRDDGIEFAHIAVDRTINQFASGA